ncbi:MAG: hypothetical protein ABI680_20755 [Chthoniobacteraceae bacterium]
MSSAPSEQPAFELVSMEGTIGLPGSSSFHAEATSGLAPDEP